MYIFFNPVNFILQIPSDLLFLVFVSFYNILDFCISGHIDVCLKLFYPLVWILVFIRNVLLDDF